MTFYLFSLRCCGMSAKKKRKSLHDTSVEKIEKKGKIDKNGELLVNLF